MLEARRALLTSTLTRFMVEDANKMSFGDSYFDLIVSTGSLHHWKKPLRVINEVYRVLRMEGRRGYTSCTGTLQWTLPLRSWRSMDMERS